ncbi:MAG: hypothetical protein JNK53_07445 [Phycisphaerae bacterium]|nr:hypothetical protein [Phycisphaerae bacterium]
MNRPTLLAAPLLMYAIGLGIAATAVASGAENRPQAPEIALAAQDAGKYSGFMDLVNAHREAQVKMVKKWQELKGQNPVSETTMEEYKKLQVETGKASNKVVKFIQQSRWTDEDRTAMNKIWSDVIAKPVS